MYLKKDLIRSILWLGFFSAIILSWIYLYNMSIAMGFDWTGKKNIYMSNNSMNMNSMVSLSMLFPMWSVMMIAMMVPAMIPTLLTYQDLIKSANGSWLGWIGLLLGYVIIWLAFSISMACIQSLLTDLKILNGEGIIKFSYLTSGIVILVGVFQFTRLKDYCHGVCISPFSYFIKKWKQGFAGGIKMGIGLGLFCVGCCWGFMILAFVMGYMNFIWMGLITLIVILEKLPQIGDIIKKPLGILLVSVGIYLMINNMI